MILKVDVIIIGSGFGGCLLAAALQRQGISTAVLDRAIHPRFAIGESSTPLADQTLHQIATEYDLTELLPFTRYGTWKQRYPHVLCGRKRGFTYFDHTAADGRIGSDQLLVTASRTDAKSDTHWLRSDVDAMFATAAVNTGAQLFEGASWRITTSHPGWQVCGTAADQSFRIDSRFIVDASGAAAVVLNHLNIADCTDQLSTCSTAIFGHFANVRSNETLLPHHGVPTDRHPFRCDDAAVHHVLPGGWMWQLRFDDESVSAGLLQRGKRRLSQQDWAACLNQHAFLQQQFACAEPIRVTQLCCSGRLQRLRERAAGANWAALPATVGFIDPLHSTGIAHTLYGVRRLAERLGRRDWSADAAGQYSQQTIRELKRIDELVAGCYAALPSFRLWSAWCMLYFAAVTSMEQGGQTYSDFLRASDVAFHDVLRNAQQKLQDVLRSGRSSAAIKDFEHWLRQEIEPWNTVGLLGSADGMYVRTAAP